MRLTVITKLDEAREKGWRKPLKVLGCILIKNHPCKNTRKLV